MTYNTSCPITSDELRSVMLSDPGFYQVVRDADGIVTAIGPCASRIHAAKLMANFMAAERGPFCFPLAYSIPKPVPMVPERRPEWMDA